MVNLKTTPFDLNDEQVQWVEEMIQSMSEEEKIGQLFINLTLHRDPAYLDKLINEYHIGGARWQGGNLKEVYQQNRYFQEHSRIPLLIAANCEAGGNGAVGEGTLVAPGPACGASETEETAYDMGLVGGKEASAIGCNWTFSPVCDVLLNWENTIVNNRAFSSDTEKVIACSKAYMKAMQENGIACAAKHFPGDGSEVRDQHLVMGCNDLSCEEWDRTYGRVYQALIADGLESIMVGHICQPAYTRKFHPDIKDEEIMPATLSPELLQHLLREQLGFNGLIVTDASHMAGMSTKAPRKDAVPGAIAAGCDMVLFFQDPEEDLHNMMEAYHAGKITEERLDDALHRILGLKAKMGLHHLHFPAAEGLSVVGCKENHALAAKAADASITLVKDTQKMLPLDPAKQNRIKLVYLESAPVSRLDSHDQAKEDLIQELEKAGFTVTAEPDFYEREIAGPSPFNKFKMMEKGKAEDFRNSYDAVIVAVNMKGYAQTNNVRLSYSIGHSYEIPWYVTEVPTLCVSLNYTNHLFDVPMMKTYINAYSSSPEYIHALVQKLIGESAFKGKFDDLVWCGRWDTKL
jgi:beta-glucosidase-like glycosyl hydrolase